MHKDPLLQREELLVDHGRRTGLAAKDQLRLQTPLERDLPVRLHFLVDHRVVVLEVGGETFHLEGGPEGELVHGGGVFAPLREVLAVERILRLELFDRFGVFEEEYLFAGDGVGSVHDRPLVRHGPVKEEGCSVFQRHTVPYPAPKPSIFFSVCSNLSSGTKALSTVFTMSQNCSCSFFSSSTHRVLCELKELGQ